MEKYNQGLTTSHVLFGDEAPQNKPVEEPETYCGKSIEHESKGMGTCLSGVVFYSDGSDSICQCQHERSSRAALPHELRFPIEPAWGQVLVPWLQQNADTFVTHQFIVTTSSKQAVFGAAKLIHRACRYQDGETRVVTDREIVGWETATWDQPKSEDERARSFDDCATDNKFLIVILGDADGGPKSSAKIIEDLIRLRRADGHFKTWFVIPKKRPWILQGENSQGLEQLLVSSPILEFPEPPASVQKPPAALPFQTPAQAPRVAQAATETRPEPTTTTPPAKAKWNRLSQPNMKPGPCLICNQSIPAGVHAYWKVGAAFVKGQNRPIAHEACALGDV